MEFFYKVEDLSLLPGNKTSGFIGVVSTQALVELAAVQPDATSLKYLDALLAKRLEQAKLMSKKARQNSQIQFWNNSACPRYFSADPVFGSSIGADPETFERLQREDPARWLGNVVQYTPHNCDTPAQALTLMLMFQTWGEWVSSHLRA